jgi:hypothetical protein
MTNVNAQRQLTSWIDSFVDLTSGTQSPEIFRRWSAIAIIAGALERKVWLKLKGWQRVLYPNHYVLLVGGPGIGKTDALRGVRQYWEELPNLHVAPSSVSRASLGDSLANANRAILEPTSGAFEKFNSLQVCAEEFGTFLSQYESEFMSTLNHLYDNIKYSESKRSMKEDLVINNPTLNLVAATTPPWLGGTLPEKAWAEGFTSRIMLIFSAERIRIDPFADNPRNAALETALIADLQLIHELFGQIQIDEEFAILFRDWYMEGCAPEPDHPKLEHYLPRRHIHFLKLALVTSISRSNEMVLRKEDFFEAMNFLVDTEAQMPEVFKAIKYNSDANVIDEVYSFVWQAYTKEKKGIAYPRIHRFVQERAPTYAIENIINSMVKSKMLLTESIGTDGANTYRPAPRSSF